MVLSLSLNVKRHKDKDTSVYNLLFLLNVRVRVKCVIYYQKLIVNEIFFYDLIKYSTSNTEWFSI